MLYPVGNITQQVDNAQQSHYFNNTVIEPKGKYKYDALYRLIEATGRELSSLQLPTHEDFPNNIPNPNTASNAMQNYTQQYTYDELGNMEQLKSAGQWTRDYFYDYSTNNYLLGHTENTTEYTYDAHGNMLTMPHLQALNWDYKDQLLNVELDASGNKAYYIYDAGGNRTRKVIEKGNLREERFYLGDYEVYRKFVSDTLETERATIDIRDDKKKIATIDKQTVDQGSLITDPTPVIRYQYDNHLGSASLELDETAEIISYEEYHPFGTTSYRSGRTETETSQKRYKYVGKERDEETGLYYYGARYYAAWLCRFVSVDPLQFDYPQLTPFNYAGNKPITHIDIDGNQSTGDEKYLNATTGQVSDTSITEGVHELDEITVTPHSSTPSVIYTQKAIATYKPDEGDRINSANPYKGVVDDIKFIGDPTLSKNANGNGNTEYVLSVKMARDWSAWKPQGYDFVTVDLDGASLDDLKGYAKILAGEMLENTWARHNDAAREAIIIGVAEASAVYHKFARRELKAFNFKFTEANESQTAALNHAIRNHGEELSKLINKPIEWTKKEGMQQMLDNFNEAVDLISKNGKNTGQAIAAFGVKGSGKGSKATVVDVFMYEHSDGAKYYLYRRASDGRFVSAGLNDKIINYKIRR